jgi:hypothetical protein
VGVPWSERLIELLDRCNPGSVPMAAKVRIDFVSDVSCPWCVIGLTSLERALSRLRGVVDAEIHCQP